MRIVQGLVLGSALAGAFAAGLACPRPAPAPTAAVEPVDDRPWADRLAAARATADAGTLRAHALEMLNTADDDRTLADAVELLGWVAADADVPFLQSLILQDDPTLSPPAVQALGRLGTPTALAVLTERLDADETRARHHLLAAVGLTRRHEALDVLETWLDRPETTRSAAQALALHGTPEAAVLVGGAFVDGAARDVPSLANALAAFGDGVPEARDLLHRALGARGSLHRKAAIAALAADGDPEVHTLLRREVVSGSAQQRVRAAVGLGAYGDPADVGVLAEVARGSSREVRSAALGALGQLDRPGRRALAGLALDGPAGVARDACWNLRNPHEPEVIAALLDAAVDRPRVVRDAARSALFGSDWSPHGVPDEVLELARIVAVGSDQQAGDALTLLLRHGTPEDHLLVQDTMLSGTSSARAAAVWTLEREPSPWASELLLALVDDPEPNVRHSAIRALQQRGDADDRLAELLLGRLEHGAAMDHGVIDQALLALDCDGCADVILGRARDGTRQEWNAAINALANSGSADHVHALLRIADRTEDSDRKQRIYQGLMWSDAPGTEGLVEGLLDEEDSGLRGLAAQAIAQRDTAGGVATLARLAEDDDAGVRGQAIQAMGRLGRGEVVTHLAEHARDPQVAWQAIDALQQVGTPEARDALADLVSDDSAPAARAAAIRASAWRADGDAQARIADAVYDDDASVREAALSALESIGSTHAAEVLAEALASDDDDLASRAARALKNVGGAVAAEHADTIEVLVNTAPGWEGDVWGDG